MEFQQRFYDISSLFMMDSTRFLIFNHLHLFILTLRILFTVLFMISYYNNSCGSIYYSTRGNRAGTRKQRPIRVHVGHRPPSRYKQPRPPNTLTSINTHRQNVNNPHPTLANTKSQSPISTDLCSTENPCQNVNHPHPPLLTPNIQTSTSASELHKLNIVLLNSWSVRNKATLIYHYIVDNDIDVLFITETWLKTGDDAVISDLVPAGYTFIPSNRVSGRPGGGIMAIHKLTLNLKKDKKSNEYSTFELLECNLKYDNRFYKFLTIYRPPPSKQNKVTPRQFLEEFENFILDKSTHPGHLLVLGDFNIHVNDTDDCIATDFLHMMESFNLTQLVKTPTHVKGNILDLVFNRSSDVSVKKLWVENSHISDHYSVTFTLNTKKPKREMKIIEYRNVKNIDIEQFKKDIKDQDITTLVDNAKSVDEKMNVFNKTLLNILNIHAPLKTKQIVIRPNTKWFSSEISELKRKRRKAESMWKKTKLHIHKELYNKAKIEINRAIKEAKQSYVIHTLSENKGNSKELFKIMNGLIKHESSIPSLPEHSDKSELAERFNTFFKQKIAIIRAELDESVTEETHIPHHSSTISPLTNFTPSTIEEISEILSKAPNKSCHLDVIPTSILKSCIDEIAPCITSIVNQSINFADFPPIFKEAHVTPLLKKANLDIETFKNYRPVSNLNFISKIIEKLIVRRLHRHIVSHNLYSINQSAYRPGHSTETALLRVHNDIVNHLDHNDNVVLLLLDLSAAFDTVDHAILLDKMQNSFGITGNALKWFSSYLNNRTQRVIINSYSSKPTTLDFGVPQGSVLGPYLFTLYTTALSAVIRSHNVDHHLYADDTQLYLPMSPIDHASKKETITNCVLDIKSWMMKNKLKFNDDKTELIIFRKKGKDIILDELFINDAVISNSSVVRNLGFYFDEFLKMQHHITKLCQIVHLVLKNIGHIRYLLDEESCKMLVHSLITSRLDYCNSLLYGLPKSTVARLQLLQNKAARIITKTKKKDHISPVLQSLHWLPVEKRIAYKIACLVFKCIYDDTAPIYLKSLVNVHNPNRPLRSSNSLSLERKITKTVFSERAFVHSAPAVWNSLSARTRNCQTLSSFKTSLKTELFRSAFQRLLDS